MLSVHNNPRKRRYEGYNDLINLGPPDYSLSKPRTTDLRPWL